MHLIPSKISSKNRKFWVISLLAFVVVANIILSMTLGLTIDEAHYSLYGQHLDWSYYDHPPMVGWIQAFMGQFGSSGPWSELGVRLPSWIFLFLNLGSIYCLTQRFFIKNTEIEAVFLYLGAPLFCALGIFFIPKVPSLFFSCWVAYFLCLSQERKGLTPWIGLGFALGFAALSEYTAVLLALGIALYLILKSPRSFLSPGPYIAAILTLLLISPVLIWNYQHDWISILYQLHHGYGHSDWNWGKFLTGLLIQIPSYGPALVVLGVLGSLKILKSWRDPSSHILVYLAWPTLLIFAYSGGTQSLHPHWTALGWMLLIPLASRYLMEYGSLIWVKRLFYASLLWIGFVYLVLGVGIASLTGLIPPFMLHHKNVLRAAENIRPIALEAVKLRSELKTPHPMIFVNSHALASRFAWYADSPVQITPLNKVSQRDFWFGTPNEESNGILVAPEGTAQPKATSTEAGEFAECRPLKNLELKARNRVIDRYYFYHCWHYNTGRSL